MELLGYTQIKLGNTEGAMKTLKPLAQKDDASAQLLTIIGAASLQARDYSGGSDYFKRVLELDPKNARLRAGLGMSRIIGGEPTIDVAVLEPEVVEANPPKLVALGLP